MFKMQRINDYPLQRKTFNLPDGDLIDVTLYFMPMQKMWVFREITFNDITIRNVKIVTGLNILRQFKNIIPFGIACESTEGRDPQFSRDFLEGKNTLYILSAAETQQVEDFLSAGQVTA